MVNCDGQLSRQSEDQRRLLVVVIVIVRTSQSGLGTGRCGSTLSTAEQYASLAGQDANYDSTTSTCVGHFSNLGSDAFRRYRIKSRVNEAISRRDGPAKLSALSDYLLNCIEPLDV